MASPLRATRLALSDETRTELAALSNGLVADAIDLWRRLKHAHWNVRGPQFAMLHELFDRLAGEVEEYADLLAERAVQLGGTADGTVREIAPAATLATPPDVASWGRSPTVYLVDAMATFASHARLGIARSEQLSDAVSADIFTEVTRGAEKALWLLEAHAER